MRKRNSFIFLIALVSFISCLTISGVYGMWFYLTDPTPMDISLPKTMSKFEYGLIYITKITKLNTGNHDSASLIKAAATDVTANIDLRSDANSSASYEITFYNSTDATYYYNEAQTVSSDNNGIGYTVTGIAQKDAVPSKSYKTLTVTFAYNNGISANSVLNSNIHFNFVLDKDSIGIVVARTAVDRFLEILNNDTSYQTLKTAMNGRGNSSTVTYIGNVAGSSDDDSKLIESLFGSEFMSMDLDGDGNAERITMMIKRENLDNNEDTGDSYTYRYLFGSRTVHGAEMTLYITAEDVTKLNSVTVYAATFTIPEGGSDWIEIVPLTQGKANTNSYSGFTGKNSFNTDTWKSTSGNKTMDTLVQDAMK